MGVFKQLWEIYKENGCELTLHRTVASRLGRHVDAADASAIAAFMAEMEAYLGDVDMFLLMLSVGLGGMFETETSFIGLLLREDVLQSRVVDLLLEKLSEVAADADCATLERNLPKLILRELRWIDHINDAKELVEKLICALPAFPLSLQRDMIYILPEIASDADSHVVIESLLELIRTEAGLVVCCIEALGNFNRHFYAERTLPEREAEEEEEEQEHESDATVDDNDDGPTQPSNKRRNLFDVFEDALEQLAVGMFETPATEEVYVVENQLNDEDSLVLLEDGAVDAMDAIDASQDNDDPDDIAPSQDQVHSLVSPALRAQVLAELRCVQARQFADDDDDDDDKETRECAVPSLNARLVIPAFTLRKQVEHIANLSGLEYDDSLPREIAHAALPRPWRLVMNGSPAKRAAAGASPGADATPSKASSSSGDLPPLRSRSPKKRDNGAVTASATKAKAQKVELPRVNAATHFSGDDARALPDSGEELEVLKCILVREGYLQRLTQASAQGRVSGAQLSATIDVLDLLRIATIEVVEAIVAWRLKRHRQRQALDAAAAATDQSVEPSAPAFQWNSLNYLLKLGSDLDFLDKHVGLTQWLGFPLTRNPFILPVNLEARAKLEAPSSPVQALKTASGASNAADVALHRLRREDSSSQFVQVGGKRAQDDRAQLSSAARRAQAAAAKALAERKRPKNPYETRVINDEELVPLQHRGTSASSRPATSSSSSSSSSSAFLLPSQIGDVDMARIRACETIVLQEEALHGRYTRDIQGQLVPEAEAVRRRNMIEMSGDAYASSSSPPNKRRADGSITEEQRRTQEDEGDSSDSRSRTRPPAPSHAKKRAGMLGPISKPQRAKPTRRAPTHRSRGAHLEEVLEQEKERNAELGVLIDRLREEIECKEMDLAYLESVPGVQYYGDELREFRGKTRRDVAQLRKELEEKRYIYESRAASLFRKEEIIHTFKENRKAAVEAHRSTTIDRARPEKALVSSSQSTGTRPNQRMDDASADRDSQSNQQEQVAAGVASASASEDASVTAEAAEQKTLRHELLGQDDAFTTPVVHDLCATLIQKVARGKLARAAYEVMKIEYYVGSKYIQAVVRGFLARRRVAKMYWQLTASVILQRMIRGLLARRLVGKKRQARLEDRSARRLQRVVRGHFGRVRMSKIRTLLSARETLRRAAFELSPSDLKELAAACLDMVFIPSLYAAKRRGVTRCRLTPLALGLVRVLMVLTADDDVDVDAAAVRWKDAAVFLQNGVGLQRRMAKAAHAVAKPTSTTALRVSQLALSLLDMYGRDAAFTRATFERLERGWRAATAIFDWIHAFAVVSRVQDVLLLPPRPRPPAMASLRVEPPVAPTLFRGSSIA
ncbi:hypothetical protein ATCC90586_005644 [Pythium insidiosum]|nr:hypothetical protein ATCC90586_005644 [Pythium insidiosum]